MKICTHCGRQYASEAITCSADGERLKLLTCPVDEYLGRFLADLPYDFEDVAELGPNTRGYCGDTPLHIAALRGDIRAIELLLDAGADINAPGEDRFTPLHYAAEQNKPEAIRLLLKRGADPRQQDQFGQIPRDIAEMSGGLELMSLFHERAS